MGKLTVANLLRTVRALGDANGGPPRSARLIGENLWRLTADMESTGPFVGAADLLDAVRQVFDVRRDRLIPATSDSTRRLLRQKDRLLRFDPEHHDLGFAVGWGDESLGADSCAPRSGELLPPEPAKNALIKALGAIQARDTLGQQHWVIVVVNAHTPSVALPPEQLSRLRRSSRLLILWCEEELQPECEAGGAKPAAAAFEQLAAEPGLICLGPIGGLARDGVVAVLEALKALEQPAVLHLRLKRGARAIESDDHERASPAETHAGQEFLERSDRGDHSAGNAAHAEVESRPHPRAATAKPEAPPATTAELAARRLARLAQADRRILAVNLSGDAGWQAFGERLPDRYFESPAGELDAIPWCSGLADGGCRPFVALSEAALLRCSAEVIEEIGDLQRPVTLIVSPERRDSIGPDRTDGLCLPAAMAVMVPGDAAELDEMLACAASGEGPAAIWLPSSLPARLPTDAACASERAAPSGFEFGRAVRLKSGVDVALLALGGGASLACEAADRLAVLGVSAAVLNLRFARPLDETAICDTARGARAVAIVGEDVNVLAGAALEVLALLRGERPAAVIGASAAYDPRHPRDRAGPQIEDVVRQSLKLLESCTPALAADSLPEQLSAKPLQSTSSSHTPEDERRQILASEFSPTVAAWIRDYSEVGERSLYLWRWCLHGVGLTTLPCVSAELREHACETKFLSGMLNVLLDDVSDRMRNGDLLDELLKVTGGSAGDFARFSAADRRYAEFTSRMWNAFWQRAGGYPNFAAYKDLLQYDLTQLFNTVRYSHLVNDNLFLLNLIEHDNYSPQGMGLMSFSTVDLMCTDRFPRQELAALREAIWHAQWMARIGNLITTWQREIGDGDYSSGVFARAVGRRDLTIEQLRSGNPDEIEAGVRRGEHETHFLRRWNYHRERLRSMRPCIQTFDLNLVIEGLERLLLTELGSRGRK